MENKAIYLKLEGKPAWLRYMEYGLPVWSTLKGLAHVYHTDELMWDDFDALKRLDCKVIIVVDSDLHN